MSQLFLDSLLDTANNNAPIWKLSKVEHRDRVSNIKQSGWTVANINNDGLPQVSVSNLAEDSETQDWTKFPDGGTFTFVQLEARNATTEYVHELQSVQNLYKREQGPLEKYGILSLMLQNRTNGGIEIDPDGTPRNVVRNGSDYKIWSGVIYSNQIYIAP